MRLVVVCVLGLAGCCPDLNGRPASFTAGPVATRAYRISAPESCPTPASSDFPNGAVTITGTGPDPARVVSPDWLRAELRAHDYANVEVAEGAPCGRAILYVKVDNWFVTNQLARTIASGMAAEQLQGDVMLFVDPQEYMCAREVSPAGSAWSRRWRPRTSPAPRRSPA